MKILDRLIETELKFEGYVPFTPVSIVARHLDKKTNLVLDLGCGTGEPAFTLKRRNRKLIGVDAFAPYLAICLKNRNHWSLVQSDVRQLPLRPEAADTVVCLRVLEHLSREEGKRLIDTAEACSKRQVIFSLPVGSFERPEYHDNPFQAHQSAWMPQEFRERGYRVRGSGLKWFNAVRLIIPHYMRFLLDALWVLTTPISYFWPEIAGHMVCIKNLDGKTFQEK